MKERKIRALATTLPGVLLVLAIMACGTSSPPARSAEECHDRYEISLAVPTMSPAPETGSGVLEQRVLQNDLVVWAELVSVEYKAVENDQIALELKRSSMDYRSYENSGYEYALLGEVELRVHEYLKGEGPDLLTAFVEGQVFFDSSGAGDCAKLALEAEIGPLFGSIEGIALLNSTGDSNVYHLGRAHENFGGKDGHHSTWLPYHQSTWLPNEDGSFYIGGSDGWIGPSEVRRRVSSVIEEYTKSQDEKWQNCVYWKYFNLGKDIDPWAYRGAPLPFHRYRDHHIIFNGEHVPVLAGTMVWKYPDPNWAGDKIDVHMRIEGKDAHLFDVAYHSESELTFDTWRGTPFGRRHYLAIWHRPNEEQWTVTFSGHVITAASDLEEGEYEFNLVIWYGDDEDFVDCGQDTVEPQQFRVFVDRDRPTVPPAPNNVQVTLDREGWRISWDPVYGAGSYRVKVYRLVGDEEEVDIRLDTQTTEPQHDIRLSDMKGCGDVIYVEIWPHGNGTTYLSDYGESSAPIDLRTEVCPP